MKILCISDEKSPLVYSPAIKDRFQDIDLVLSAGDLRMSYHEYIVTSLNKPLYFVFGNHHIDELKKIRDDPLFSWKKRKNNCYVSGGKYIGEQVEYIKDKDLILVGLGGCPRYNEREYGQYRESEMLFCIICLLPRLLWNRLFRGRCLDILLSHAPPRDVNDRPDPCHRGFKIFRWFLRRFKPRYMIHGHIHLFNPNSPRITRYHSTTVINAYHHHVLDYPLPESPKKNP